jgi:hypothetical protein
MGGPIPTGEFSSDRIGLMDAVALRAAQDSMRATNQKKQAGDPCRTFRSPNTKTSE